MKLVKIEIENIKKFANQTEFVFQQDCDINTISGRNGAGKSTIFECLMLCQKAYFVKQIEKESMFDDGIDQMFDQSSLHESVKKEMINMVANPKMLSKIKILMRCYSSDLPSLKGKDEEKFHFTLDADRREVFDFSVGVMLYPTGMWQIEIEEYENEGIINEIWNLNSPSNIIVFLGADKDVYEEDFSYQKINMMDDALVSPVIQFILNSKGIYQNMYSIVMDAYIYQRLNPQKTPKDLFVTHSKRMFKKLMYDISISNFSSKEKINQFILMASSDKKFDARNMSSGEKLVWYSILILNYLKKIGLLIIDEPENHLHEQLSWRYISFLQNVCSNKEKELQIGQVFLITHSKNIIYNNFADGNNYVVMPDGNLQLVNKTECESILRACGISYIDDKILFIEGKTESELLTEVCKRKNIKLRELANCHEIEQVFNSLLKVKEIVYAPLFAFMIDKDTRDEDQINDLRNKDTDFFDRHFIVLPVHEIENLLLDEKIILEEVNLIAKAFDKPTMSIDTIHELLKQAAEDTLEETKKKYINYELHKHAVYMERLFKKRDILADSKANYEAYIDSVLSSEEFKKYVETLKNIYIKMENLYGRLNWESNWDKLCDGKIVYNKIIEKLSKELGVSNDNVKKKIQKAALENANSKLVRFMPQIYSRFEG